MDLVTHIPDILGEERFANAGLVLASYDDYSDYGPYQIWSNNDFSLELYFNRHSFVNDKFLVINLDTISPTADYWKYKSLIPPLLAEFNGQEERYILTSVRENLKEKAIEQTWEYPEEEITVLMSGSMTVKE
ncbi:hypothetical protein [Chitinophaga arvensicola]|uniref:Uncharacterized protein n=1 Tax=Chitinophaga arvensicola TaxID=29529 RepID=A0A1I0S4R6_9BACT|nr:hypothetical protein [Chitinophaga arvensicola]SEW49794.1 hypothetical protein SAMN04488122_3580 [Chitinophaga arvensicola]